MQDKLSEVLSEPDRKKQQKTNLNKETEDRETRQNKRNIIMSPSSHSCLLFTSSAGVLLVVAPEGGHEGKEVASSSENEHPKNENPAKPVQPPGQGTTSKTTDLRRSERKSSTSLPKT